MTAAFRFGSRSETNLVGVNAGLVKVVRLALIISNVDFAVIEGLRSKERQRALYAQGRTAPGKIVTWTLHSKHINGNAVDLLPINPATNKPDWDFAVGFREVSDAMFAAADRLGIRIRWGKDWNGNGIAGEKGETDTPHFELA